MFMVRLFEFFFIWSFPPHGGAAQPVVDGFAKTVMRNWHDRNRTRALGIERAKIAEKIGGGLVEIAASDKFITASALSVPEIGSRPKPSNASPGSTLSH